MTFFRRTFHLGRMNKDVDNRVLPQGEYREAVNMTIINSENSDEGQAQKSYSNKRLTNLSLGSNPVTVLEYSHEFRDRLYYGVVSDSGSYLIEWDNTTQSATFVLQDTRIVGERVFDLRENFLCTGVNIVSTESEEDELFCMTDNNMQPLCFNISRAKTYGVNGFDKEDLYLVKKQPRFAPVAQLTFTGGLENYMEEVFLTFSYRYKYLDGGYSALSDYTNYKFSPGRFDLDYQTTENLGMVNQFNAVRLSFDTGDKRVTEIQIVVKKSNSNTLYLIETFNKEKEAWGNNEIKSYLFANTKIYQALPADELFRLYDNVPLKAKAQTLIGNRILYGNYLEGYNMVDANNNKIKPEFSVDIISNDLTGVNIDYTLPDADSSQYGSNSIVIDFTDTVLSNGAKITFAFDLQSYHLDGVDPVLEGTYSNEFQYILNTDYDNVGELAQDPDFIQFVEDVMTNLFLQGYDITPPDDSQLHQQTDFSLTYTTNTITITAPVFTYRIDNTPGDPMDSDFTDIDYEWRIFGTSQVIFNAFGISSSAKTNRSYEVALIYIDEFGRRSTAITSKNNTIYIPQSLSTFQNKLKITIDSAPPSWADRFKIAIKQSPLSYKIIYGVVFYTDGIFRWVLLDGANKDKVKEGDILIVKSDLNGPVEQLIKIRVIEVKDQEKDFLDNGSAQVSGKYMKIKPTNFNMNQTDSTTLDYIEYTAPSGNGDLPQIYIGSSSSPTEYTGSLAGYLPEGEADYVDIPITSGTRIHVRFHNYESDGFSVIYEKDFIVQGNYDNFQDWWEAEVIDLGPYGIHFEYSFFRTDHNALGMFVEGQEASSYTESSKLSGEINIILAEGVLIFETEPVITEDEIYYETELSFEINSGFHEANIQNQTVLLPAIIECDFFNCYAMGNGAECYQVKDLISPKHYLNNDLKPTTTTVEPYRQIRRQTDLTYGEAYIESLNINGLNVFNPSTLNYKELEKSFGSIQKIHARENNVVVLQEEKAGLVQFKKNTLYTSNGQEIPTSSTDVLGQYIPYQGTNGISTSPESFAIDEEGRIYYANTRKGVVCRLSNDGITPITYGLKDFFRDLFKSQPNAKIIGGYDPYFQLYAISIGNEPVKVPAYGCESSIIKYNQTEAFTYEFNLNNLGGDIVVNYDITGNATIEVEFNGTTTVASNVTGIGSVSFERDSLVENIVTVTITPIGGAVSYTIQNSCPVGSELKIVSIILNDNNDTGQTMTDRFKKQGGSFYSVDELFSDAPLTRFETITGLEGVGIYPANGDLMTVQAFKDNFNSGHFATTECNRLGYLVSSTEYDDGDIETILGLANFLTITQSGEEGFSVINSGNFVFSRSNTDEILYLIWDYTSRNPVISDDTASVNIGQSVIIDVLDNDEVGVDAVVTIGTQPQFGTAVVNIDKTITYTHDGSENLNDSFTYLVTEGGCSSTATVTMNIGISCGDSLSASGGVGIYEVTLNFGSGTGICGIAFDALNVPDRFQLYWDGNLVADSKYRGDGLAGDPPGYTGLLGDHTLNVFEYNGSTFVDTGVDEMITVIQDDIADGVTEPTAGDGIITFNKTTALPATVTLRVTGPVSGTAWNITDVYCPGDTIPS